MYFNETPQRKDNLGIEFKQLVKSDRNSVISDEILGLNSSGNTKDIR